MRENVAEITWKLHRTMAGAWVVLSSVPIFSSMNRTLVENWLVLHGCARQDDLDRLFEDAEEKGEGIATVPLFRSPEEGY
jgi:hypothetical protein